MSIPGLVAQPLTQTIATALSPFDAAIAAFNSNPYFVGIMMLILNLGGRFLMMEVSKEQELFFQNPWTRRFLIFIVFFVATRSIVTAFWLTLIAILFLGYVFNENSALCIFSSGKSGSKCAKKTKEGMQPGGGLTPEETEILRRLNEKSMRYANTKKSVDDDEANEDADASDIYMANIALLRGSVI